MKGWNVAMSTLMYERGSYGARLHLIFKTLHHPPDRTRPEHPANGRPAAEDPVLRQKLAQCSAEIEIMRFNQMRAFSRITATGVPGPEGSIQKIFWSELTSASSKLPRSARFYGQLLAATARYRQGIWSYATS